MVRSDEKTMHIAADGAKNSEAPKTLKIIRITSSMAKNAKRHQDNSTHKKEQPLGYQRAAVRTLAVLSFSVGKHAHSHTYKASSHSLARTTRTRNTDRIQDKCLFELNCFCLSLSTSDPCTSKLIFRRFGANILCRGIHFGKSDSYI